MSASLRTKKIHERKEQLTEECVRECDCINPLHIGICRKVGVNEEENGHVDGLAGIQLLLFETKTLDFAEIGCYLARAYTICRNANDIIGAFVRGSVECQCGLAR